MNTKSSFSEKLLLQLRIPHFNTLLQCYRTNDNPAGTSLFGSHSEAQTLLQRLQALCALSAPIRQVPNEVLIEIFEYVIVLDGAAWQHTPVITLARVCTLWRRLVLCSPALWARASSEARISEKLADFALAQATKRGPMLDVRLIKRTRRDHPALLERRIDRGDGTKTTVIEQCKHLHIATLFTGGDLTNLCDVATNRVASLQTLRLMVSTFAMHPAPVVDALSWMRGATKLRSLAVSGIIVDRVPFLSLHALRELTCTLYVDSVANAIHTLAILPPTVHCRLIFYPPYQRPMEGEFVEAQPTTSAVECLSIGVGNQYEELAPETTKWFLQSVMTHLTLPSVHTLSFIKAASGNKSPPRPLAWPQENFLKLASSSSLGSHLRTLDLRGVIIGCIEIFQCLEALPHLARLSVADDKQHEALVTDAFWMMFTLMEEEDDVAPSLHTLTVHTRLEFKDAAFIDFLVSRTNETLGFACHVGVLPGHWVHSLEDIRADGLVPQQTTDERRERLMNNQDSALFELRKRKKGKLMLSFSSLPDEILV